MARAKLPISPPMSPFFVLRWDVDTEDMVIHLSDEKRTSFSLGDYLPQVVRQLILWGIPKLLAEQCTDAAKEFRAVQVVPSDGRVINLIPRGNCGDTVAEQFKQIENVENQAYGYL